MLALGHEVNLRGARGPWRVGRLLGEGSQGRVVEIASPDGRLLALKWYQPASATPHQREAITTLVQRGSPGEVFLWPLEIVEIEGVAGFGYVMPLRPEGFVPLADLLRGKVDAPPSVAIRICLELAHAFLQLHAQGLCYRDISFGNIMVDPVAGGVSILDNDNVGVDGVSRSSVLGTRRFMAPEIIRGEAKPNAATDLHSLAVIIFYVLMVGHPLLGKRELEHPFVDREVENELFGRSPLFVFDPFDDSNAPDPVEHAGVLANWAIHPQGIRDLFVQAFGEGLSSPARRVRESVWRAGLARVLDAVVTCPGCGRENLIGEPVGPTCWACRAELGEPLRLVLPRATLLLGARTRLVRHHLRHDYDHASVVGEVTRHPTKDLWGLRNVGVSEWSVEVPGRPNLVVAPGQAVALVPGTRVTVDGVMAELQR